MIRFNIAVKLLLNFLIAVVFGLVHALAKAVLAYIDYIKDCIRETIYEMPQSQREAWQLWDKEGMLHNPIHLMQLSLADFLEFDATTKATYAPKRLYNLVKSSDVEGINDYFKPFIDNEKGNLIFLGSLCHVNLYCNNEGLCEWSKKAYLEITKYIHE